LDLDLIGKQVIGVGTDIIEVDRIRKVIERTPSFVERIYTDGEIEYCFSNGHSDVPARLDPKSQDLSELILQRLAARFAAKEAVMKALGVGLGAAEFKDIEVVSSDSGKPELKISGKAKDLADSQGISGWLVSLSHSDTVAQAFVAAIG